MLGLNNGKRSTDERSSIRDVRSACRTAHAGDPPLRFRGTHQIAIVMRRFE
jgi:hypothetical protein